MVTTGVRGAPYCFPTMVNGVSKKWRFPTLEAAAKQPDPNACTWTSALYTGEHA